MEIEFMFFQSYKEPLPVVRIYHYVKRKVTLLISGILCPSVVNGRCGREWEENKRWKWMTQDIKASRIIKSCKI